MKIHDPIMPVRKRKRRIAKKIEKRYGMKRVRGGSIERLFRITDAIACDAAEVLNNEASNMVARSVVRLALQKPAKHVVFNPDRITEGVGEVWATEPWRNVKVPDGED
jgi:hypothetical protein